MSSALYKCFDQLRLQKLVVVKVVLGREFSLKITENPDFSDRKKTKAIKKKEVKNWLIKQTRNLKLLSRRDEANKREGL